MVEWIKPWKDAFIHFVSINTSTSARVDQSDLYDISLQRDHERKWQGRDQTLATILISINRRLFS